ncbi:phage SPO1 DNA polymerase-related protein [Caldicellulosiruptor owensensis OL]|uniref:Type-4 uracil-DNA glycosylase n=1 Tax=Caldicellulosiruptor owensensis (strain ATCC 700167 / DSM 13100 / OL) TaxID=632518 RepID=E4Q3P8_CALOW|nr:uracil-DNA glycosylase [Caldicellulosiruptor owensensis]ADQ05128.1 phage SPO1 DNA polymerase-related protein [Caldicellulosiruptor owensensis OL]
MLTWEELENACISCEKCPISKNRTNVVVGDGNKNAKLVFVGEAPGEEEDKQGKPFVGRAGKFLDLALTSLELSREKDFYICNILKCRPPNNRVPTEAEAQNCLPFLRAQIKLISPKIIVCLGATAMKYILGKDLKITQDRGKWFEKGGFWIMATYHPAALLRDPGKREDFYRDLKSVKQKLEKLI